MSDCLHCGMNMQTPTIKVCEGCGVMRFGETGSKVLDSMTADLRSSLDSTTLENVRLVDENRVLRAELADSEHTIQTMDNRERRYNAAGQEANGVLKAALGEAFGKLWGPDLEELWHIVDRFITERDAAIKERDEARADWREEFKALAEMRTQLFEMTAERDSLRSRVEVLEKALDAIFHGKQPVADICRAALNPDPEVKPYHSQDCAIRNGPHEPCTCDYPEVKP